jgi:N-acylglucosamine 2-epimerase
LGQPVNTPLLGYPLRRQFHLHAHDMIRLTVASALKEISPDPRWEEDLTRSAESVIGQHWQPDLGVLLENIGADGRPCLDLAEGRMVNPGHAIETAWMLMELAVERDDQKLLQDAIAITVGSLERCWDWQYGGMRYLFNCDGTPVFPPQADQKLWWPHAEALYALLLAWSQTGRSDLAVWYRRLHDYVFSHFPDPRFGEWFGYLNRDGSIMFSAKANGWKGFFHAPRVLLRNWLLLTQPKPPRKND